MRIVYWNIRAGGGKRRAGIFAQLQAWQPDIIGLSEFRGTPASQLLAMQLHDAGWNHQLNSVDRTAARTNALLLAANMPLRKVETALDSLEPQRWLLAQTAAFTVGLMHIPNFHTGRKYPFHAAILDWLDSTTRTPIIFGGDTNSGKRGIDEERTDVLVFKKEHDWMEAIEARDWIDAHRHLNGLENVYTWYSHKNNGFRLDQAFLNPVIAPALVKVSHQWGHDPAQPERRDALSDHCAVIVDLNLDALNA